MGQQLGQLFSKRIQFEEISHDAIIIVVIGPHGAGKSTFINTAAGKSVVKVGHKQESCTTEVQHVQCTINFKDSCKNVVFVDTPAFPCDNTDTGLDIELRIRAWATTFAKNKKISGILYLHKISDNRLTQRPLQHYQMFKSLFGEGFHTRVLLVTTMWDTLSNPKVGEQRKEDLKKKYWSEMINKGSEIVRHDWKKQQSAWSVVERLLTLQTN